MARKMTRPVIDVVPHYEGNATIYEAFGKVYAQIFREKLKEQKSAPLKIEGESHTLKSS
jgi:hypothetical protein